MVLPLSIPDCISTMQSFKSYFTSLVKKYLIMHSDNTNSLLLQKKTQKTYLVERKFQFEYDYNNVVI